MKKFLFVMMFLVLFIGISYKVEASRNSKSIHQERVLTLVEKANDKIEFEVFKAQNNAEKLLSKELSKEEYDQELNQIIEKLVLKTNRIAAKTISFGEKYGVTIICEYNEYQIGDQIVLIDPLLVGGW